MNPSLEGEPSPASMPGVREAANVHWTFGPRSPHRGFAHKGTPAALPGLAIGMAMARRRDVLHLRPCGPKRVSRD
jgi:hypothetical protein